MIKKHTSLSAFSLVELSIVLVILGLLVGGILSGQSLIRAAELRSITTDYQRYVVAAATFRDKYFAIPGDMNNATAFWGSLGGTGNDATCQAILATGTTATCNGDGGGTLGTTLMTGTISVSERTRFWQHLANAGLIEGSYSGAYGTGYVIGTNAPKAKVSNTYFVAAPGLGLQTGTGSTYWAGDAASYASDYGLNMLYLSGVGGSPLKPEEAWNIDTKLDDGDPAQGRILAFKGTVAAPCTSDATLVPPADTGHQYVLSNTERNCMIIYTKSF